MKPLYTPLLITSSIFLLASVFNQPIYAADIDYIRQVIINDSNMGAYYELVTISNNFCTAQGYLSPGQTKAINCGSPDSSSYGTYILEVQPEGWQGYAMHDSMIYTISQNAEVTWRLAVAYKPRGTVLGITVDEKAL